LNLYQIIFSEAGYKVVLTSIIVSHIIALGIFPWIIRDMFRLKLTKEEKIMLAKYIYPRFPTEISPWCL